MALAAACFLAGCAEQSHDKPDCSRRKPNVRRMQHVRTTAYTHTKEAGASNALGNRLSGHHLMSAASDWSRFPLGTRFRIAGTKDEYIIDDYGTALIGTNTIDLYKPTQLEMKRWGVRHVDIDILQWGSEEESLKVLGPRKKHHYVRQMVARPAKEKSRNRSRRVSILSESDRSLDEQDRDLV